MIFFLIQHLSAKLCTSESSPIAEEQWGCSASWTADEESAGSSITVVHCAEHSSSVSKRAGNDSVEERRFYMERKCTSPKHRLRLCEEEQTAQLQSIFFSSLIYFETYKYLYHLLPI